MTRTDRAHAGVARVTGERSRGGWARTLRDAARDPLGAGAGLVWVGFLVAVGRIAALLAPAPRGS